MSIAASHIGPSVFPFNRYEVHTEIWKQQSQAYWSKVPNGTLVLFVHGWTGRALDTWADFPGLWSKNNSGCDLFFYGYSSVRPHIKSNAATLMGFLEDFMAQPARFINEMLHHIPSLKRDQFQVTNLIIVAHSLGAVIVRDALLRVKENLTTGRTPTNTWIDRTKLVLFAPAHCGSRLADRWLAMFLRRGLAHWALHSISDLRPGCQYLHSLQQRTVAECNQGATDPFKASRIVFPSIEDVVEIGTFPCDPQEEVPFEGVTHSTVCKPTQKWRKPISLVEQVL